MRNVAGFGFFFLIVLLAGCQQETNRGPTFVKGVMSEQDEEERIDQNLAQLAPADRKLAEEQRMCPIMQNVRLGVGSKGPPTKLTLKGETVFVCCSDCERKAMREQDQTIAKTKALRAKYAKSAPEAPAATAKTTQPTGKSGK